jgi:hypothetical protein
VTLSGDFCLLSARQSVIAEPWCLHLPSRIASREYERPKPPGDKLL